MNRAEMIQALAAHQAAAKALREQLERDLRDEVAAGTVPSWKTPDGTRASATMTHDAVVVTDEDAFMGWARRTLPDEVAERTVVEFRHPTVRAMVLAEWGRTADALPPFLARRAGGEFNSMSFTVAPNTKRRLAEAAGRYAAGEIPAMPVLAALPLEEGEQP